LAIIVLDMKSFLFENYCAMFVLDVYQTQKLMTPFVIKIWV